MFEWGEEFHLCNTYCIFYRQFPYHFLLLDFFEKTLKHKMLTEINLTALVSIDTTNQDKKELEKIVLIKVPAEDYPTLYETFIFLFSQAGIKNISIEKEVNFEKMYNEKIKS